MIFLLHYILKTYHRMKKYFLKTYLIEWWIEYNLLLINSVYLKINIRNIIILKMTGYSQKNLLIIYLLSVLSIPFVALTMSSLLFINLVAFLNNKIMINLDLSSNFIAIDSKLVILYFIFIAIFSLFLCLMTFFPMLKNKPMYYFKKDY